MFKKLIKKFIIVLPLFIAYDSCSMIIDKKSAIVSEVSDLENNKSNNLQDQAAKNILDDLNADDKNNEKKSEPFRISNIYSNIVSAGKNFVKKRILSYPLASLSNSIWGSASYLGNIAYDNSAKFRSAAQKGSAFAKDNAIKLGIGAAGLTLTILGIRYLLDQRNNEESRISKIAKAVREDPKLQLLAIGGVLGAGYLGYKWYKNSKMQTDAEKEKLERNKVKKELEVVWRNKLNNFLSELSEEQYSNCAGFYEVIGEHGHDNPKEFVNNEKVLASLSVEQKEELEEIIYIHEEFLRYIC